MSIKLINIISFGKLSNAYHISFMDNVKSIVERIGYQNLSLSQDIYNEFKKALSEEQDIVNRSRASEYTKMLDELDQKRDNLFRQLYYKVKAAECDMSLDASVRSIISDKIVKQYSLSICNEGNQRETALLRGFTKDLVQFLDADLEDMGIKEAMIKALDKANDDYANNYVGRLGEKSRNVVSAEVRSATEMRYTQVTLQIAANANVFSTDLDVLATARLCGDAIDQINMLIKDFKVKAYKSGNSDAGEEDSTPDLEEDTETVESEE